MRRRLIFVLSVLPLVVLLFWRIHAVASVFPTVSAQNLELPLNPQQAPSSGACGAGQIDLLEYMGPSDGPEFSLRYCAGDGRSGNEGIRVTRETVNGREGFKINKGGNAESYFYDSQYIYFYEDTSWDRTCTDGGAAFYRVRDASGEFGGRIQRCVSPGATISMDHEIVAFREDGSGGITEEECDSQYEGGPINIQIQVSATPSSNGPAQACFPDGEDTIMFKTLAGIGVGEEKFYTRGYGLTGFYVAQEGGDNFHSTFDCGESSTRLSCQPSAGNRGAPPAGSYYKRFVYPFFSPARSTVASLKEKLQNDYSVTCANPVEYETYTVGAGNIRELLTFNPERCKQRIGGVDDGACLFEPSGTFMANVYSGEVFGTLRNEIDAKWRAFDLQRDPSKRAFTNRFESVEQWFGANNPVDSSYNNQKPDEITEVHQGPYFKLASEHLQCLAATEVLKATAQLCGEWKDLGKYPENTPIRVGSCVLETRPIQGGGATYAELHTQVNSVSVDGTDFCNQVYKRRKEDGPVPANVQAIADRLQKVDLYQEIAYRPAFLVMVSEVDSELPPIGPGNDAQKFLAADRKGAQGQHMVEFLVYHVPDTLTDIRPETVGFQDDILMRTVNLFTPREVQDERTKEYLDERARVKTAVQTNQRPGGKDAIDCRGGVCDQVMRKALIEFINAYMTTAGISCNSTLNDQAESGRQIGSELAPIGDAQLWDRVKLGERPGMAENRFRVQEYFDTGGGIRSPRGQMKTRIFNVAPYVKRSENVAESFDALFTQLQTAQQFTESTGYLSTFEVLFGQDFQRGEDLTAYAKLDPGPPRRVSRETVGRSFRLKSSGPLTGRILNMANAFNYSTRAVVQNISGAGSALLDCAKNVSNPNRNTEDFLKNCQTRGTAVGESGSAPTPYNPIDYAGLPRASIQDGFSLEYWNGSSVTFEAPPALIWDAINRATQLHGCDPYLVLAVAHSESPQYTNHQEANFAGARGVWQFTGSWNLWWRNGEHQPSTFNQDGGQYFNCSNSRSESTCSPTNIYAAADAACRLINWTGMNNYENDQGNFVRAFGIRGDNSYGQVWNLCRMQGEYVWRLWKALKDPTNRDQYLQKIPPHDYRSC